MSATERHVEVVPLPGGKVAELVTRHKFGYQAWLVGESGTRLPVSIGGRPSTMRGAVRLARQFLDKVYFGGHN